MPEYLRSELDILDDCTAPGTGLCTPLSRRACAATEVLRRIPAADYQKLVAIIDEFEWFIPGSTEYAMVRPFGRSARDGEPCASVLYLSPVLEGRAFGFVVACVAHELAHIVLGHNRFPSPDQNRTQEQEAWTRVAAWGFGKEARQHEGAWKAHWTRQAAALARLRSENRA